MGNRTGRHEPPVARVRTGRDSPGREREAGRDGPEQEWKTGPDDLEGEWEKGWDSPEGERDTEWDSLEEKVKTEWDSQEEESETEWDSLEEEWKTGWGRQDAAAGYKSKQQKAGRKRSGSRRAGVRVRNAVVSVLLTALVLVSVGAVGFLILQISGKNSLYSRADSSALVSTLSEMAVELGDDVQDDGTEDWQEGDIRYNGIHYRYNADILTFLFLGIDEMGEVKPVEDSMSGGQSDAIFLLVLDPHEKKISVIGIPRDTMAEVEIYSREGIYQGKRKVQLALQHAYGDGGKLSCERSMAAVSNLFYGLPVHGYCAINMGAVPLLNDAVGGVSLEALETLDFGNYRVEEGQALHLEGMDAYYYLHNRDTSSFNSAGRRLERQKQYLNAYASAVLEAVKADITFPITLYNTLSRYMVTDITVDEVGFLASQVSGYHFSSENIHSLAGSTQMGERFEEFLVDEEALYRLILEVFYEEVS